MGQKITEKAMLAYLNIGYWSATKQDKKATAIVAEQTGAKDAGRFLKNLVTKEVILKIERIIGKARDVHYFYSLPWERGTGAGLLSNALYFEYREKMAALRDEFDKVVKEEVLNAYKALKKQAETDLGPLYKEDEYPTPKALAKKFHFAFRFRPVANVSDFRVAIQEEEVDEIRKEMEASYKETYGQMTDAIYERLLTPVKHMAETLKDKNNVAFHGTLVTNVTKIAEMIPKLNVLDDPKLEQLGKEILDTLCAADAKDLKKDGELRKHTAKKASEMMKKLVGFMGEGGDE